MKETPGDDPRPGYGHGPEATRDPASGSRGAAAPGTGPTTPAKRGRGKGVLWAVLAVVVAFLIGFGWQWYEARTVRDDLARTEQDLRVERLRVHLAEAALAANAGDYEEARGLMSDLFTRLQEQEATLSPELSRVANDILARRDEVITGLSRANPEYAGVLYRMVGDFTTAAGPDDTRPGGPEEPVSPAETGAGADTPGEPGVADTMP